MTAFRGFCNWPDQVVWFSQVALSACVERSWMGRLFFVGACRDAIDPLLRSQSMFAFAHLGGFEFRTDEYGFCFVLSRERNKPLSVCGCKWIHFSEGTIILGKGLVVALRSRCAFSGFCVPCRRCCIEVRRGSFADFGLADLGMIALPLRNQYHSRFEFLAFWAPARYGKPASAVVIGGAKASRSAWPFVRQCFRNRLVRI